MRNNKIKQRLALIIWIGIIHCALFISHAHAIIYEGELVHDGYQGADYAISHIKVKYRLSTLFQEPLEKYHLWWESADQSLTISNIKFRANVDNGVATNVYLFFSPAHIPRQKTWSQDIPGSPSWDDFFSKENGRPIDAKTAKAIFRKGFTLSNLTIVDISARRNDKSKSKPAKDDPYKSVHDQASRILRKVFKKKTEHCTENDTEIDRYLFNLHQNVSTDIDTDWKAGGGNVWLRALFAEDVESPQITHIINELGSYYYVFIKIGPLYSYYCENQHNHIDAPVDLKFKMVLKVEDLNKVHAKRVFDAQARLFPGEVITFADRIPKPPPKKKDNIGKPELKVDVEITPKATKTCDDIEKLAKNPFEKQLEEEEKRKLAQIRKEAKNLGAVDVSSKRVVLTVWDFGTEDGDRVEIRLNDNLLRSDFYLTNTKKDIELDLKKGINYLQIKSLDGGNSPPNTAEFTISEKGRIIAQKQWRLDDYQKGVLTFHLE